MTSDIRIVIHLLSKNGREKRKRKIFFIYNDHPHVNGAVVAQSVENYPEKQRVLVSSPRAD